MHPESRMRRFARELTGRRHLSRAQNALPLNFEEQLYAAMVEPADSCRWRPRRSLIASTRSCLP